MKKQHFGILFCAAVLYGIILLMGYLFDAANSNTVSIWALPFSVGFLVGGWAFCGTDPTTGEKIE